MYDYINGLIVENLKKTRKYVLGENKVYLTIIFIKYLLTSKTEKLKIQKLLEEDSLNQLCYYLDITYNITSKKLLEMDLKAILRILESYTYNELLDEFLEKQCDVETNEILSLFKKTDDKILYLNTSACFECYTRGDADSVYICESIEGRYVEDYTYFKLIDEMIGKKVKYYGKFDDVDLSDYDLIIVNDTKPHYTFHSKDVNMINSIERKIYLKNHFKGKLVLRTNFNKISKFPYRSLVRSHLSKVLLHENIKNLNVYMEFVEENKNSISLILLNEKLTNDKSKLQRLIESNRARKNVLIKIKPEAIFDNNFRISFKMYQLENKMIVKKINDIVDENSRLTEQLDSLNESIALEVDKLLERQGD